MEIDLSLLDVFCDFTKDGDAYICSLCGNRITYSVTDSTDGELPKIPCPYKLSKPIKAPKGINKLSWFKKLKNFAIALVQHIRTGGKRTSKEERDRRFNICLSCEHYDGTACTQCGCPITRYQKYISKLDWKDQKCPIGKW